MGKLRAVLCSLALLAGGADLDARPQDWQQVRNLRHVQTISVVTKHRTTCIFEWATDEEIRCTRWLDFGLGPDIYSFARKDIREVRAEHSKGENAAVAGVAAGGACAIATAVNGAGGKCGGTGVLALILGAGCGAVGAAMGRNFKILPGRVVYKR